MPKAERAYVPTIKLTQYLLSDTHPVGSSKARFLRQAGFHESHTDQLSTGLLSIAHSEAVAEEIISPYGVKYVIEGTITAPTGVALRL
ncbi:MAG: DUF6883 domain-containing protein [Anaerolineales bacterium]